MEEWVYVMAGRFGVVGVEGNLGTKSREIAWREREKRC